MKSILFCLIFTAFITSCAYKQANLEAPSVNDLELNQKFRITLPENHTNGFMWQLNNNFDDKIIDYYGSVFHGNEKGVDFNFKSLQKGKTTLNFALIKYRDTSTVKQFIIEVK
jgi:predicted secreted protein